MRAEQTPVEQASQNSIDGRRGDAIAQKETRETKKAAQGCTSTKIFIPVVFPCFSKNRKPQSKNRKERDTFFRSTALRNARGVAPYYGAPTVTVKRERDMVSDNSKSV